MTAQEERRGRAVAGWWLAIPLLVLLLSAAGSGALTASGEWHISLSFTQPTFTPGQPLTLTGSLSPGQQATIVLTVILPDGSTNIFYVDTDSAGGFNFSHLWGGLGYYGAFGIVFSPKTEANVTTDIAHCIVTYVLPTNTTTETTTTAGTTTSSTTSSTTTTSEGGSQTASGGRGSLPYEVLIPPVLIAVAASSFLAMLLIRRSRHPGPS